MKSFDQWTRDLQPKAEAEEEPETEEDLPEGLEEDASGMYFYCRSCEKKTPFKGDAKDFDYQYAVCMRSQYCLP